MAKIPIENLEIFSSCKQAVVQEFAQTVEERRFREQLVEKAPVGDRRPAVWVNARSTSLPVVGDFVCLYELDQGSLAGHRSIAASL